MIYTGCINSMVPESPRWLLLKGHTEEAVQVLKTLAAGNGKPLQSLMTLKKGQTIERSSTILDLFSFQSIFIRTTVITAGWYGILSVLFVCSLFVRLSLCVYLGQAKLGRNKAYCYHSTCCNCCI